MKLIKRFIFFVPLILLTATSFAQMIEDPTTWKYEVKKKGANDYQLIFHLDLKAPWHIWSLKPGGDGFEIAPSFTFADNAKVKMKGKITESGKKTTTKIDGIDGKVTYFNGKIEYVQEVSAPAGTKIAGTHQYQVCNDKMCLPPKDKDFVFDLK